uniref:Uncharacterized protein n=1 Tax=Oryza sativa subsp. japonica TaxID=39947 RepID=Q5VPA4_ORYSJ|nr:hypothetical protein [Oryza sativa Japonica Group]BAD68721.1 hypothetical protein [Oryza sativa Japonica Group]
MDNIRAAAWRQAGGGLPSSGGRAAATEAAEMARWEAADGWRPLLRWKWREGRQGGGGVREAAHGRADGSGLKF